MHNEPVMVVFVSKVVGDGIHWASSHTWGGGELRLRQCRSALLLVLVFARDFGALFAEFGCGKNCITQITENRASPKSKRGCFL